MANIVVTGGCGFIGRNLLQRLTSENDHAILVIDNLSVGSREELEKVAPVADAAVGGHDWSVPLALCVADITDGAAVMSATKGADVIIHLAANTGVAPSVEDPHQDCANNVTGTLNMLEACRHNGISRFVFASSGAPVGVQEPPLHEAMAPRPASPYGASKLAGEGYCSAYYHSFGIETVALRFGNAYGVLSDKKSSVVAKFILGALRGETLEIYGDGAQTRDFIYVGDIVAAMIAAFERENVGGEVFQIATSAETSVRDLAELLFDVLRAEGVDTPELVFSAPRVGDVARNYSDTSKAEKRLGWKAEVPLRDGLERTVRYFTGNR